MRELKRERLTGSYSLLNGNNPQDICIFTVLDFLRQTTLQYFWLCNDLKWKRKNLSGILQGNELKYIKVSIDKFFQTFKLDYAAMELPSLELLCWVHTGITNSKLLTLLVSIIFLKGLHSFQNLLFFTAITWASVTPFADKMADNYTELVLVTLRKLLATFSLNHNHVAHCYLG